jgi:hypothetical protein
MTPTELTLRKLRADGYVCEVTERWNPHARVRNDLFGFIDVVALRGEETLAVQATSAANVSKRVAKIAESPMVGAVREAGWTIRVWGWAKVANRWTLKRDVDVS